MAILQVKAVNFGINKANIATVGFTLYGVDGTVYQGRSTTGVYELAGGCYGCNISFVAGWSGTILWDTGGSSPVYACEVYDNTLYNKAVLTKITNIQYNEKIYDDNDVVVQEFEITKSDNTETRTPV